MWTGVAITGEVEANVGDGDKLMCVNAWELDRSQEPWVINITPHTHTHLYVDQIKSSVF